VSDDATDIIYRVSVGDTSFTAIEDWCSTNPEPFDLAWDGTNIWSITGPGGGFDPVHGEREIYKHDAAGNIIEIWHYPPADDPGQGSYGGFAMGLAFAGSQLWYCDYDKNQIIEAIFSQPAENWQIVYQTDFSSDPGWITSWPDRYVWDPATGTYCFSHIMYTYSYVPIAYDPTLKYKLEFDINLTQCEWGSYFNLGLWDADMLTKGPTHWHVRYHHVDEGNSACIVYWTNDLYGGGDSPIMPFALNTWYHNKAIYDPTSDMFTLEITRKDDGVLLGTYTLAAVGEFLNIERLGISCTQSTYGDRLQAGCIDNVVLSTLAAGPPGDLKGRIAFVSPSGQKIYVMNADGSSRQQLSLPPLDIVHAPQWSRDGLWLTFSGGPGLNSQIYIVRPDGSGFRRVTNGSGDMVEPSFSPDGSQIAFCGSDGTALYIISTDGTGLRRLPVDGSFPEWWPLGDKILYSNWGRTYESDLFLYDCAAGQSIQITHHTPGQAFIRAAWSPNGRRLAVDFRDRNRTGNKRDVLIMNADGSNPYNFTAAWPDSDEGAACWSPDGQFILFVSDRTGNFDIWYSPVDVFSPVNITNSPEDEDMPAMGTIPEAQPVYYVDAVNGNDNNNGLSRRTAFATIAKGIDSATNRYKVLVYPGVYREEVDFKGKAITIQGVATKAGIPIIENPGDFAVSIYRGEGPRAILKNFVIKNSFMAVFIAGSSPTIKNLNIIGNKYGIEAYAGAEPDISNCIFWENSDSDIFGCEARYSCTSEPGQGNIAADPCFVDPNNSDYHLLSQRGRYWPRPDVWVLDRVTSPCIDGGNPDDDVLDEPMPNGGRIDMGSFGGTPYASMSEIKWLDGDVNHDGRVNLSDLAMLAENWLSENNP
jgi:hypothetical protein